jgi:hypothetical protein
MMFDELQQEMAWEVEYVEDLDESVIGFIAKTCGMNANLLRDQAGSSALIQAGFFSQRIRAATKPPWCILRKPAGEALAELAAGPRPSEETLAKIWDLCALGYSRPLLEKGLWLLGMAGWSSTPVEQAHVAASGLMRKHSDYGQKTLSARAMLVSVAPLFKPSETDLKMRRLELRLQSLQKRRPECISGRQVFLKDLNTKASELKDQGRHVAADMHTKLMHRHGVMWKGSGADLRAAYETKAEQARDQAREELVHKKQALVAEMQILRARSGPQGRDVEPLRISSCRLSETHIAEFDGLYHSPEWSSKRVDDLQAAAMEPLGPPPLAVRELLEAMEIYHDDSRTVPAAWVPLLCQHRSFFQSCLLRFDAPGVPQFFRFIFAMQSPYLVCLLPVQFKEPEREYLHPAALDEMALKDWVHVFEYVGLGFVYSDEDTMSSEWNLHVLPDVIGQGKRSFVSDGTWMPIAEVRERCCQRFLLQHSTNQRLRGASETKQLLIWMSCLGCWTCWVLRVGQMQPAKLEAAKLVARRVRTASPIARPRSLTPPMSWMHSWRNDVSSQQRPRSYQ